MRRSLGSMLAVTLVACAPASRLTIDVRTDLLPGIELNAIQTTIRGTGGGPIAMSTIAVFSTDDYDRGERVAEIDSLARGDYDVVVEALDADRRVVVSRTTHLTFTESYALVVLLTRDCRGVTCPASGSGGLSTCEASVCVDPRCRPDDRTHCPMGCTADGDCVAASACAAPRCVLGTCLQFAGTGCGATERCDPQNGCVPVNVRCDPPLTVCGVECTSTEIDPQHCGSCTNACTAPPHAMPDCSGGTCGFVCDAGYAHCGSGCANTPCGGSFGTPGTTTFTVPEGCTRLDVVAWGAGGGTAPTTNSGPRTGAAGGFASATLAVVPGHELQIVIGAAGGDGVGTTGGAGGEPGGGRGATAGQHGGGGGGGYTGVFDGAPSQATALVIAGVGGGAGGAGYAQGAGGGTTGQATTASSAPGTQTAGGAPVNGGAGGALVGGNGVTRSDGGGGGGAGYFGGGGAPGAASNAAGGGGGSGFVTSSALASMLATGSNATPPMMMDPRRGSAGEPSQSGLVVLTCE